MQAGKPACNILFSDEFIGKFMELRLPAGREELDQGIANKDPFWKKVRKAFITIGDELVDNIQFPTDITDSYKTLLA